MSKTKAPYDASRAVELAIKLGHAANHLAASLAEFPDDPSASAEWVQALGDAQHELDRALGLTDDQLPDASDIAIGGTHEDSRATPGTCRRCSRPWPCYTHELLDRARRAEDLADEQHRMVVAAETRIADDRRAVLDVIRSLQEEAHHYWSGTSAEKLRQIVGYYREVATESLAQAKAFRDDVVVQLRALSLVVDMTGSAHTHAEKGARLRGLSEILEESVTKLRDMRFDLQGGRWWPDVLRSDFPTHELIRKNRWQEDTIASLQAEIRRLKGEPEPADGEQAVPRLPEIPF